MWANGLWTHSVSVCCWWRCDCLWELPESCPECHEEQIQHVQWPAMVSLIRSCTSERSADCPSMSDISYWIEYKYRRTDLPSLFFVCTCSYNLTTVLLPLWLFSTVCSFVADFLSTFYPHQFMYMFVPHRFMYMFKCNFLPSSVFVVLLCVDCEVCKYDHDVYRKTDHLAHLLKLELRSY